MGYFQLGVPCLMNVSAISVLKAIVGSGGMAETKRGTQRHSPFALGSFDLIEYLTSMRARVSSKGQIVLPAEICQLDEIEPGQEFEIERIDRGEYRLLRNQARSNEGLVEWLLACPKKGFFTPIASESTEMLW